MTNINYYAKQYNESKNALRQLYQDIALKIINDNNYQNMIHAIQDHDRITIVSEQSGIPLISTDIPFGFITEGERVFTENFTHQMHRAIELLDSESGL